MITAIVSSWLILSALVLVAFCVLVRGRRLALVPRGWRSTIERVRCRVREIDADLEIVEWRRDAEGSGSLVVDRGDTRMLLPLRDLRNAPSVLLEERLRDALLVGLPRFAFRLPYERSRARARRS